MNKRSVSSLVIAVMVTVFAVARASAQDPAAASPVTIGSCGPQLNANGAQTIAGLPLTSQSSGIAIEFVNTSAKTANLVNFGVDSNGETFVIRDVGTFSPGVSIKHVYRNGAGQAFILPAFIAPRVHCRVVSVKFTDGTSWRPGAPAPPAPAAASGGSALTASPARIALDRATDAELFLITSHDPVAAFRETDDCAGIAGVFVAATGQASATFSVRPLGTGACTARVTDESGRTIAIPISIGP